MDFQDITTGTTFSIDGRTYTARADVIKDQFSISNGLKVYVLAHEDGEECWLLGHPFEVVGVS